MNRIYGLLYTACGGEMTQEWFHTVIKIAKRQWRASFFEFRKAFSRLLREQFGMPYPEGYKKMLIKNWVLA
jgi:hypothetical protein